MQAAVIVTTYNRPRALQEVLRGLNRQTCPPAQVAVADDGSGPETVALVERATAAAPYPLKHVWQEDHGFRAARIRNRAIEVCDQEYIILLDGDCIPGRHFVDDHLRLAGAGRFFQGKRILVGSRLSPRFTAEDANSPWKLVFQILRGQLGNWHHLVRVPFVKAFHTRRLGGVRSCNMGLFRKDLAAVNGFNQDFEGWGREDTELVVRLYRLGLKRMEHPFMAACFHLWHPEHDRRYLAHNDRLLEAALTSDSYFCENGLVSGGRPHTGASGGGV